MGVGVGVRVRGKVGARVRVRNGRAEREGPLSEAKCVGVAKRRGRHARRARARHTQ